MHQSAEPVAKNWPAFPGWLLSGNNAIQAAFPGPIEGPCRALIAVGQRGSPATILSAMRDTFDRWLAAADGTLRTLVATPHAGRPLPPSAAAAPPPELTADERRLAGALMRVNHVGEVCAQALYQAQSVTARNALVRRQMAEAAREETDHLAWTARRLEELGDRPSLLNPLWYAGAFGIGLLAGRLGDDKSLAFVVETERQVEQHLDGHLGRLPAGDTRSRAIVEAMRDDERQHAERAAAAGAAPMPWAVKQAMRLAAKVMTLTAHRI